MRVKRANPFVPRAPIALVSVGLRRAEAGVRPKPKHLKRIDRRATTPHDMTPRLIKRQSER